MSRTFDFPGLSSADRERLRGLAEHHALVADLATHEKYGSLFLQLAKADSQTGRAYFDVGNRVSNSIVLLRAPGEPAVIGSELNHVGNHPTYSALVEETIARKVAQAFKDADGVIDSSGNVTAAPQSALVAAGREAQAYSNGLTIINNNSGIIRDSSIFLSRRLMGRPCARDNSSCPHFHDWRK